MRLRDWDEVDALSVMVKHAQNENAHEVYALIWLAV